MSKVSAKSVIESGIKEGKSVKFILGQVAKKCPDSKADESHVRFYANKLVRDGELDAETVAENYGCGARGRKASDKPATKAPKTKVEKPAPKAVKKVTAKAETPAKKSPASKKSASAAPAKTSKKVKSTSKE